MGKPPDVSIGEMAELATYHFQVHQHHGRSDCITIAHNTDPRPILNALRVLNWAIPEIRKSASQEPEAPSPI